MTSSRLRIVELRADSVKRLQAVAIRPDEDGHMVVLSGRNGQGKSSVLDAIAMALGGREQIPSEPIRRGAERAEVVVDLGEIVVRRTFSPSGGSSLVVSNKDGARFSSPQTMLDALVGRLSFDPLGFAREKPARQAEVLRDLLGLDFSAIDREREDVFGRRTDVNREAKSLKAQIDAMPDPGDTPDDPVDVAELAEKVAAANAQNLDNAAARRNLEHMREDGRRIANERDRLRRELEEVEERLRQHDEQQKHLEGIVAGLQDVDTAAMREQIRNAEETNRRVRAKHQRRDLEVAHAEAVASSEHLTKKLAGIDAGKAAAIAKAAMPVEGLGFDESGHVTFKGLPLDQASAAERLRVSVAIGIAMNPRLRVLLIRDASLLDQESLRMVADMASAADCQLWVERVETDAMTTVVIEDGMAQTAVAAGES